MLSCPLREDLQRDLPLKNLKILLVESDSAIADLVTFFLETEGANVEVVDTTEAAFNVFQQMQPDLILCNLALVDGDGDSFLQKIRNLKFDQSGSTCSADETIKVIAIASCPLTINRQQAVATGFQNFPFEPTEYSSLIRAITQLINHKSPSQTQN